MQNFKNYLSQLSKRDTILLIASIALISFVILKLFIIDALTERKSNLIKKSATISQQETIISSLNSSSTITANGSKSANQLINSFLKQNSSSNTLKQIRTTNDGSQRFELEDITFTTLVNLLNQLESNDINYNNLQIKKTKENGIVDAIMTIQ